MISMQAVLVLYKLRPEESPALQSLLRLMTEEPGWASVLHPMICDNSPGTPDYAAPAGWEYHHDPTNPGLAKSYNRALRLAAEHGDQWLMLLDQDTVLTREYLEETWRVMRQFAEDHAVVALAPKLAEHGTVHSPHGDLVGSTPDEVPPELSGVSPNTLHVFNSGAVIRVAALEAVGGFPEQFWLDFLDHATFHLLQSRGGKVYVMQATLQHQLSTNAAIKGWDRAYLARHWNVLQAEGAFYRMYGTPRQKRLYRLRLLRHGYGSLKHLRLPMVWQLLRMMVRS